MFAEQLKEIKNLLQIWEHMNSQVKKNLKSQDLNSGKKHPAQIQQFLRLLWSVHNLVTGISVFTFWQTQHLHVGCTLQARQQGTGQLGAQVAQHPGAWHNYSCPWCPVRFWLAPVSWKVTGLTPEAAPPTQHWKKALYMLQQHKISKQGLTSSREVDGHKCTASVVTGAPSALVSGLAEKPIQ